MRMKRGYNYEGRRRIQEGNNYKNCMCGIYMQSCWYSDCLHTLSLLEAVLTCNAAGNKGVVIIVSASKRVRSCQPA